MKGVPNTMGELRRMLAETMHEVRYGHMNATQGVAVAKVAAQIANLIDVEIKACQMLTNMGQETQVFGELPINRVKQKHLTGSRLMPEELGVGE